MQNLRITEIECPPVFFCLRFGRKLSNNYTFGLPFKNLVWYPFNCTFLFSFFRVDTGLSIYFSTFRHHIYYLPVTSRVTMADSDTPMAEPAGKRKRTEVSGVQHTTQSEPWFKDGNIVLEAEGWQFRVHRSILAAHSSILEATFETPQSPKTELVEGCPVVRLSDTAQDLEYVLKALCYRRFVFLLLKKP